MPAVSVSIAIKTLQILILRKLPYSKEHFRKTGMQVHFAVAGEVELKFDSRLNARTSII